MHETLPHRALISGIMEDSAIWNNKSLFQGPMLKYWRNRHRLFSRYDEGILMTRDLWFSVTPENISLFVAKFIHYTLGGSAQCVLDLFCGGGGNTIQFLRYFPRVIGLDINETHVQCTVNNATVYFDPEVVAEHLKTIIGSWPETQIEDKVDVVFASPPWGGPEYSKQETYDLAQLEPLDLAALLRSIRPVSERIVLFLPRNCDVDQIKAVSEEVFGVGCQLRILYLYTKGYLKGMICCWGEEFMKDFSGMA